MKVSNNRFFVKFMQLEIGLLSPFCHMLSVSNVSNRNAVSTGFCHIVFCFFHVELHCLPCRKLTFTQLVITVTILHFNPILDVVWATPILYCGGKKAFPPPPG